MKGSSMMLRRINSLLGRQQPASSSSKILPPFTHSVRLCKRCSSWLNQSSAQAMSSPDQMDNQSNQDLFRHIHQVLGTDSRLLRNISHYHFNGLGKAIRPNIVITAAKAFNSDSTAAYSSIHKEQIVIAMVAEMIHTASLVHDDIIDESLFRRGNPSVFSVWGQASGGYTGDYIIGSASVALTKLRHNRVMQIMSRILEDLVQGEFMQLGTKTNQDERFNHYIEKSYRKTASLIANSCQAAAVLSGTTEDKIQAGFNYGKNLGISFQLIDDALDYIASEKEMGKPTGADLTLGLATAPVLFASHQYPRLNSLIMRRFDQPGDVEEALTLVKQSCGLEQTHELADRYGKEAMKSVSKLQDSIHKDALIKLVNDQLIRSR